MEHESQRRRIERFLRGKLKKAVDTFCIYQWIDRCHFQGWWQLAVSLGAYVPPNSLGEEYHKRLDYMLTKCRSEILQTAIVESAAEGVDQSARAKDCPRPQLSKGQRSRKVPSARKTRQLEFWQQLKEYASKNQLPLKLRTPRPQHWYNVAIGRSDRHVTFTISARDNKVGCELYIRGSKDLYRTLLSCKDDIEKELCLSVPLDWRELPAKKASRIRTFVDFRFSDAATWQSAFEWLTVTCTKFRTVFSKEWKNCA
jgi:hypothetical protein